MLQCFAHGWLPCFFRRSLPELLSPEPQHKLQYVSQNPHEQTPTLRNHGTGIQGVHGFGIRRYNYGLGPLFHIWAFGPLEQSLVHRLGSNSECGTVPTSTSTAQVGKAYGIVMTPKGPRTFEEPLTGLQGEGCKQWQHSCRNRGAIGDRGHFSQLEAVSH